MIDLPEDCPGCGANFPKGHLCFCHGVGDGRSLGRETHALAHRTDEECLLAKSPANPLVVKVQHVRYPLRSYSAQIGKS